MRPYTKDRKKEFGSQRLVQGPGKRANRRVDFGTGELTGRTNQALSSSTEGKLEFRRFEIDVPFYRQANATEQICKAWIAMKIAEFGQDRQKDKKRITLLVGFLEPLERVFSITQ